MKKIAHFNKRKFDEVLWKSFVGKENQERKLSTVSQLSLTKPSFIFIFIIALNWYIKNHKSLNFKKTINQIFLLRIVNNFIFHGLGLRSNDLGINPYGSFALSAFIEIISILFTFKLLKKNFRRTFYFIFMTSSGICCTTIYFSSKTIFFFVFINFGN